MKVQIVSKQVMLPSGTTQLRCIQPAEFLDSAGIQVKIGRIYKSLPQRRSIIIIHRGWLDSYTEKFIRYARLLGSVLVYDTDDLLFDDQAEQYISDIAGKPNLKRSESYRAVMRSCDVVLVATRILRQQAATIHPDVRQISNALSDKFARDATASLSQDNKVKNRYVTIAYLSGSNSHDRDFLLIENALLKALQSRPNIKVLLAGHLRYSREFETFGDRFEYWEAAPYAEFSRVFQHIDINLVPLETDQVLCQAKSELKYIEAGVYGIPSVVSPTALHQQVITHDVNGKLVKDNDWYGAIVGLSENKELREQLGIAARKHVLQFYSAEQRTEDWLKLVTDIWAEYGEKKKTNAFNLKSVALKANLELSRWFRRGEYS